jgi:hypothetical protein
MACKEMFTPAANKATQSQQTLISLFTTFFFYNRAESEPSYLAKRTWTEQTRWPEQVAEAGPKSRRKHGVGPRRKWAKGKGRGR